MAKISHFKEYAQGLGELFPQTYEEIIPQNAPVRFVSYIIDQLNFDDIYKKYPHLGRSPYHPRMMFKVLIFAYMNNVYSCREIEDCILSNVRYMWLAANQKPDFVTINRFRQRVKDEINKMFVQVVKTLANEGHVSLDVAYIDGTKIESKANRYTFVWRKTAERSLAKLHEQIPVLLEQVEDVVAQDKRDIAALRNENKDKQLVDIKEVNEKKKRLKNAIAEATDKEEQSKLREKLRAVKELEEKSEKISMYEERIEQMDGRNSMSKTDPDATFMRLKEDHMKNGQTKPAYNLQIATENQFILHADLYPNANDVLTLPHFLTTFHENYNKYPAAVVADGGYGSEENYEFLMKRLSTPYIKYNHFHSDMRKGGDPNPFHVSHFIYNKEDNTCTCPQGQRLNYVETAIRTSGSGYERSVDLYQATDCSTCPMKQACNRGRSKGRTIEIDHRLEGYKQHVRELLTSEEGKRHRARRCIEPEAVFGQMKYNMHYRRFRHFGKENVKADFLTFAIAFNIKKLIAKLLRGGKGGNNTPHCAATRPILPPTQALHLHSRPKLHKLAA